MDNDKVMGRRQFFSRFFPVFAETIVEKTKDETKVLTNSSITRQADTIDNRLLNKCF